MSAIDNLISKLCPNGVPTYPLGEIGETVSGLKGKSKNDFSEGNAPYVSYVDISNNPALNFEVQRLVKVDETENQNEIKIGDVLITGSSETRVDVGLTSVVTIEPKLKTYINSFCFIWRPNSDIALLPNFSKHLFRSKEFRDKVIETANGVTRQNISKPKLLAIRIPIPPIEVQSEIIRVLDKFSELEADLSLGLEAELIARKDQFQFYRQSLLTFDVKDVPISYLGDIYEFQYGKGNTIPVTGGEYPVYGSNGVVGTHHEFNSEDAPVIGHIGYAGIVNWASGKHFVTYNGVICKIKDGFDPRFGYHLLMKQNLRELANEGSQPFISYDKLKTVEVQLPQIEKQKQIAILLDTFDELTNKTTNGLSTEIKARRQQFEYYRHKLLTFKELEVA